MNTREPQWHQETQVIERLTRVEEKLDALLDRTTDAAARTTDHDVRIRNLEAASSRILGMGTVIALLAGIGGSYITTHL